MNEKQQKVVSWLLSRVGNGYIMGATGQTCTLAFRQQQAQQYATYDGDPTYGATKILGVGAKWDGKPVFDCQGLARRALEQIGIKLPSGATSQWNAASLYAERGAIGGMISGGIPGALVFRKSKSNASVMSHVGVCIGDGYIIEAKSTADGVVKSKFPGNFTDCAVPIGLLSDEPVQPDDTPTLWVATVTTERDPLRIRASAPDGAVIGHAPRGGRVEVLDKPAPSGWVYGRCGAVQGYMGEVVNGIRYLTRIGTAATSDSRAVRIYAFNGEPLTAQQANNIVDEMSAAGYNANIVE